MPARVSALAFGIRCISGCPPVCPALQGFRTFQRQSLLDCLCFTGESDMMKESVSARIPHRMWTCALLPLIAGELFLRPHLAETQKSPNHLVRACSLICPDFSAQQRSHGPQMLGYPTCVIGNNVLKGQPWRRSHRRARKLLWQQRHR